MIKRLIIHRFRGIKKGILDDLGQINLLIGPNNSGKTAILEMLYLGGLAHRPCSFMSRYLEPSAWPARTLDIYDFLGLEALPRLRQRHGEARMWKESPADITVDGSLTVSLPDIPDKYPLRDFELAPPLDSPGRRKAFSQKDINRVSMFQLEPWEGYAVPSDLIPLIFQEHDVRLENGFWSYLWEDAWIYYWGKTAGIDNFAIWAMEGTRPKYVAFFDFHVAEQHFNQRFAGKSYKDIPDWEMKIAQSLGRVLPELEGAKVSVKPKKGIEWTGYIEFPGRTPLPIDHFGDGARHAFKVLAGLVALCGIVDEEHSGLFLWEDPELFMHPATLGRLLQKVIELVKLKPIQVFITTQSLEMIAWVTYFYTKRELNEEEIHIDYLNLDNGKLRVHKFHIQTVLDWLRGGLDLREIETGLVENFPLSWKLRIPEKGEAPW